MLTFLFGILFSKAGLIGIGGGLAIAAVVTAILRFPWWVPLALAIAAVVHIYSGSLVHYGRGLERAEWVELLEIEQNRQQAEKDKAEALAIELATARATIFGLTKEKQDANDARIIAEEAAEQARLEAESASGGVCPPRRCVDTQRDVDGLYDILR